ncbi:MAG: glycosyltransferase family 39 protein [Candidatus Paceibacterota bacterium]|jgi:hypothetical protein
MLFFKKYRWEIAIFALALVVRCLYLGMSVEAWGGDVNGAVEGSDYYFVLSENILAGNGFSIATEPPYEMNSFRTPVMPYFLAAAHKVFGGYLGAVLFQVILASLLPLLGMVLAWQVVRRRDVCIAVGIFLALEPFTILFSTIFYSETVFTFIFLVSLLYFFKYVDDRRLLYLLFSGAFMGFAILTKPTVEFLPLFLGALLLWLWRADWKRGLVHVTYFFALCALVVAPWVYRNYIVTGSPGLSPQTGVQLYTVLWPSVAAMKNGTSFQKEFQELIDSGVSGPNNASVAESAQDLKLSLPLLLENPVPLALVSANNALGFFTHDGVYDVLRHLKIRPDQGFGGPALFFALRDPAAFLGLTIHFVQTPFALVLIMRVIWVALTVLCILGMIRYLMRERRPAGIAAIIIVLYFMLTTLVVGLAVNARYRLPVNVFITAFAAYAALPLIARLRPRHV